VKNSQGSTEQEQLKTAKCSHPSPNTTRGPNTATVKEITMDSEDLEDALAQVPRGERVYVSGMLSLEDAEE